MSLTLYLPIFLGFMYYACRGERQWAIATVYASFAEAASPFLLTAGGRLTGFQTVYLLIPIGIIHAYTSRLRESRLQGESGKQGLTSFGSSINLPDALMLGVTLIGISGAILLPRIFNGQVSVTSSTTGFVAVFLRPSSKNYIQAVYMVANAFLYFLFSRTVCRGVVTISQCIRAIKIGASIVMALGLYQLAGSVSPLPWPNGIINSNSAYAQYYNQTIAGIRRLSSTYTEPSVFAMHFVGLVGLYMLGLRRIAFGLSILVCLLISTSATGYAGLALLVFAWILITSKGPAGRIVFGSLFVVGIAVLVVFTTQIDVETLSIGKIVMSKLRSHSGISRSTADVINMNAVLDTFGLGVGVGSTRSSSFLVTFLACTGIPGALTLALLFYSLIRKGMLDSSLEMKGLAFGATGFICAWLVSVPDLTYPLIWLLCAMLRAGESPYPSMLIRTTQSFNFVSTAAVS